MKQEDKATAQPPMPAKQDEQQGKVRGWKRVDFVQSQIKNDPAFKRWLREQDEIIATYNTQDFRGY